MSFEVSIAGSDIRFPCAADERILDAAERAGYAMPYSCRKGVCESCRSTLTEGAVSIAPFGGERHAGEEILCCTAMPLSAVEIAPPWIKKRRAPERVRLSVVVHKIEDRSKEVAVLHLRPPIGRRIPFAPGQYVTVQMEGGESRNYSIANPPHHNDVVELHVRRVPGGRFSDQVLGRLSAGSSLELELPFGLFTWSEHDARPAIMLATGTGFAPLKSMIADLAHRKTGRPVHLFWGGERESDLYDLPLVQAWEKALPWFHITPVLADPDEGWTGARGFVQDAVLAAYDDLSQHEVYACGNPIMIDQARARLVQEGSLAPDAFYSDAFVFSGEIEP